MEHVNIISKEAITTGIDWPVYLVAALAMAGIVGTFLYFLTTGNYDKTIKGFAIFGIGGLVLMLLTTAVCSNFFKVPTGRYKYEATIDKEKMTVAEYEEFMNSYNHKYRKNEIYYFEDCID